MAARKEAKSVHQSGAVELVAFIGAYNDQVGLAQEAAKSGDNKAVQVAKLGLMQLLMNDILPTLEKLKTEAAGTPTAVLWDDKAKQFQQALDDTLADLGLKETGNNNNALASSAPAASASVNIGKTSRGRSKHVTPTGGYDGTGGSGSGKRKSGGHVTFDGSGSSGAGSTRRKLRSCDSTSTGSSEKPKPQGGNAKTITHQSNRYTRKKEILVEEAIIKAAEGGDDNVDARYKALITKATPENINKAEEEGWPRTVYLLLTYDEIVYTGPKGGRVGSGKERRKNPLLKIRSAGPFNRDLEIKALRHACTALSCTALENENGELVDGTRKIRSKHENVTETVEVEYKMLLVAEAEAETEAEAEAEVDKKQDVMEEGGEGGDGQGEVDDEETDTDSDDSVFKVS